MCQFSCHKSLRTFFLFRIKNARLELEAFAYDTTVTRTLMIPLLILLVHCSTFFSHPDNSPIRNVKNGFDIKLIIARFVCRYFAAGFERSVITMCVLFFRTCNFDIGYVCIFFNSSKFIFQNMRSFRTISSRLGFDMKIGLYMWQLEDFQTQIQRKKEIEKSKWGTIRVVWAQWRLQIVNGKTANGKGNLWREVMQNLPEFCFCYI